MTNDIKELARQVARFAEVTALVAFVRDAPKCMRCLAPATCRTDDAYYIACDECRPGLTGTSTRPGGEGPWEDLPQAKTVRRLNTLLRDEG